MTKTITIFTKYDSLSASVRERFIPYAKVMKNRGYNVDFFPLIDNENFNQFIIKNKKKNFFFLVKIFLRRLFQLIFCKKKILIIQYELFPFFPPIFEFILTKFRIKYIIDIDDAVYLRYQESNNFFIKFFFKKKFNSILLNASYVFVGNRFLRQKVRSLGQKKVKLLPTCVSGINKKNIKKKKRFTVVWIGSPSTTQYIDMLKKELFFLSVYKNISFRIIGSKNSKINKNKNIKFLDWNENTQDKLIKECHIGIMPLKNNHWEKGKCGYKILQYMRNGLPVIASSVGANKYIIKNNINGFLATNKDDWIRFILNLKRNKSLSKKIGLRGQMLINKNYNHKFYYSKYIKIIEGLIN